MPNGINETVTIPKARENLGKAIEILEGCGADGWVEKYEKELALIA